jgi:hypothetical protein
MGVFRERMRRSDEQTFRWKRGGQAGENLFELLRRHVGEHDEEVGAGGRGRGSAVGN